MTHNYQTDMTNRNFYLLLLLHSSVTINKTTAADAANTWQVCLCVFICVLYIHITPALIHTHTQMEGMPIKASFCDAWYEACIDDKFCASDDGNFFSCALEVAKPNSQKS